MAEYDAWAEFYDLIHRGVPGEAEFYVDQAVKARGPVLELGCGTGRISLAMAMAGVEAVGLDNSPKMLAQFRKKLTRIGQVSGSAEAIEADMASFDLGRQFDLIAIPYRSFMHLMSQERQLSCLERCRRHLTDQGKLILNVWAARPSSIGRFTERRSGGLQRAGRYELESGDWLVHFESAQYDEHRQIIAEEHVLHEVDHEGEVLRTIVLPLTRMWATPREMAWMFRACGFAVDALFGDFECGPFGRRSTEAVWALKKRKREQP
jgi:SAM-dependent methyltransferase